MKQREIVAEDHVRPLPPIVMPGDGEIEVVPKLVTPEAELELFMHEWVTVTIAPGDENSPPIVELSVNGKRMAFPRGQPTRMQRKYVERLARARKTSYSQNLDPSLGEGINKLNRRQILDYPFGVNEDTDKGREWIKRMLAEA